MCHLPGCRWPTSWPRRGSLSRGWAPHRWANPGSWRTTCWREQCRSSGLATCKQKKRESWIQTIDLHAMNTANSSSIWLILAEQLALNTIFILLLNHQWSCHDSRHCSLASKQCHDPNRESKIGRRRRRVNKSWASKGSQTHNLSVGSLSLYHCATTTAEPESCLVSWCYETNY